MLPISGQKIYGYMPPPPLVPSLCHPVGLQVVSAGGTLMGMYPMYICLDCCWCYPQVQGFPPFCCMFILSLKVILLQY